MRIMAAIMAGILALAPGLAAAQADQPVVIVSTVPPTAAPLLDDTTALEPFVVTAHRYPEEQIRALKGVRATSVGVAAAGTGLMAYSAIFAAGGPIGWAAAIIWIGATGAYLANRRLNDRDDFSPTETTRGPDGPDG